MSVHWGRRVELRSENRFAPQPPILPQHATKKLNRVTTSADLRLDTHTTQRSMDSLNQPGGREILYDRLRPPFDRKRFFIPSKGDHKGVVSMHQFEAVSQEEMRSVEGGVLGFFGRGGVRVAAKAIIYVIDKVTD